MPAIVKGSPRRVWRPLRAISILLCLGSALLAADLRWMANFRHDFAPPLDWLREFYTADPPAADIAAASLPERVNDLERSRQFWNTLLFAPPARSWTLSAQTTTATTTWNASQESVPVTLSTSSRIDAATLFPSGFAGNSAAASVPNDPTGGPTGVWISTISGSWDNPGNWLGGAIPNGSDVAAHFDSANLTTNIVVSLDTSRVVGSLFIGDTDGTNHYDIAPVSGTHLTFVSAASSFISQTSTSAGDVVSAPVFIQNDLVIHNLSTHPFSITGNIASSKTGGFADIYFTGGAVNISGDISNGTTGTTVGLRINGGVVNLSGTNTYTGPTSVTGGTLFVKGDNSGATGTVQVAGSGSVLEGIGTIGGPVVVLGGTITPGDTTQVGKLTLTQSLTLQATEGGGATFLANLEDDLSDLLAITGNLSIGSGSTLNIQGAADGITTYTLATFGSRTGSFDIVTGIPMNYSLVYSATDLELVPIPEPATWIGGALALGAIAFVSRRRLLKRQTLPV